MSLLISMPPRSGSDSGSSPAATIDGLNMLVCKPVNARVSKMSSALLTTTMPYMKVVIDTLKERGIRNDYIVLVGGAPLNEEFGKAVGAVMGKRKMAKHFELTITDEAFRFTRKTGENDQLFGSVNSGDIAGALESQGFKIDKRQVQLAEPFKALGEYPVKVKVFRDVIAEIKVFVEKES